MEKEPLKSFKNLMVWQKAFDLAVAVYNIGWIDKISSSEFFT